MIKSIFLDCYSESTTIEFFRVRQKISAQCNQSEVDLGKDEDCGSGDKGTEAGVFEEGLSQAKAANLRRFVTLSSNKHLW